MSKAWIHTWMRMMTMNLMLMGTVQSKREKTP